MPIEIHLSTYQSLDVSFTDGKRNEVMILQFRRDVETLPQLVINIIGPSGEVSTAMTLFALPV